MVYESDGGEWVKTVGGERVKRANDWPTGNKWRWEWSVPIDGKRFKVGKAKSSAAEPSLFD